MPDFLAFCRDRLRIALWVMVLAMLGSPILLSIAPQAHAAEAKRPNVLFIAVDDLRPELGCYGVDAIQSPNIDRLAAQGMVFDRAYCQQAVCSPSRTSLMTGLRPDSTKVWDLNTHFRDHVPNVVTLSQHFKQHGYHAVGMGKIYHGGFDDKKSWSVPWTRPRRPGWVLAENMKIALSRRKEAIAKGLKGKALSRAGRGPAAEAGDKPDDSYHDGALAEMAVKSLRELSKKDQPFFLAVGFVKPHLPFNAPKKYWDLYDGGAIKLSPHKQWPKGAPGFAGTSWGEIRAYAGIPRSGKLDEKTSKWLIHGYRACVSYLDANVGMVMDELKRLKLDDNTIVVLWGDHGWKLSEYDAWCKHTNFEIDARVPLIVSAPGMKASGKTSQRLVEFVDIYPTLSELAGLPLPKHLEGTSFKPLLDTPDMPWKKAAFSQYPRSDRGKRMMGYSMRTKDYRFTAWLDRKDPSKVVATELYDHRKDGRSPIETVEKVNLVKHPDLRELTAKLMKQLRAGWQAAKP